MNQLPTDSSPTRSELADAMYEFVQSIPKSADLEWVKDREVLFFFEAERLLLMRQALLAAGFKADARIRVLDFGYLHGLVPEFLHRFFPNAIFTVLDRPDSPIFRDGEYQKLIRARSYLQLEPCHISNVAEHSGTYDLIVLGEIIEHLDPTTVAQIVEALRAKTAGTGCLLITTPNGGGILSAIHTLCGRDFQCPPIPDETMGYGHIHLWTARLLRGTLTHFGWSEIGTWFFHGKEAETFHAANRHWGSLLHQIKIKVVSMLAGLRPQWRGFMVSAWRPSNSGASV